jgi:L-threonylcarbamoyladenylate synthase
VEREINILKNGGVGVLLTDTLYGLVGQALNEEVVTRIYGIKDRSGAKPTIILISNISELTLFDIKIDENLQPILGKYWPGPVSIILPCQLGKFKYLHRGTETLAFRLPKKKDLIKLIEQTGPLVAPSANPEGLPPAHNIEEARKYFGDKVDFYLEGGTPLNKPSTIIKINDGKEEIVRG